MAELGTQSSGRELALVVVREHPLLPLSARPAGHRSAIILPVLPAGLSHIRSLSRLSGSATGEEQLNRCPERTNLLRCCGRSGAAGQSTSQLVSARDRSAMKAFTAFSIAFTAS